MYVNGVNVPNPGTYPIEFTVQNTVGSTIIYHQTLIFNVLPNALSSVSITPVTRDTDQSTVYIFKFTTSENIPAGGVPYSFTNPSSYIEFDFETSGACTNLFRTDLGTGLTDGSSIPCYGISNISRISLYLLFFFFFIVFVLSIKWFS